MYNTRHNEVEKPKRFPRELVVRAKVVGPFAVRSTTFKIINYPCDILFRHFLHGLHVKQYRNVMNYNVLFCLDRDSGYYLQLVWISAIVYSLAIEKREFDLEISLGFRVISTFDYNKLSLNHTI